MVTTRCLFVKEEMVWSFCRFGYAPLARVRCMLRAPTTMKTARKVRAERYGNRVGDQCGKLCPELL